MIKSVHLKNFQSWEELTFDVQKGITLLKGHNFDDNTAEAAGKSAILNSICWCLFGKIPKDVNTDDIIREGEKTCLVEVTLLDGTTIHRKRGPNDLVIITQSGPNRGRDAKDTQKLIEKRIGFTYETFLQSVYFAQNSLVKFILLNEDGKAKILSQIADLSVFDEGRKKAHDNAREASLKLAVENSRLSDLNNSIKLVTDQINALRDMRIKFENERVKNIGILELKRDDIQRQINNNGVIPELSVEYYMKLSELEATAKKYREETAFLKSQLNQQAQKQLKKNNLEFEIKQAEQEVTQINLGQDNHSCSYCGSSLGVKEKQQYIQSKTTHIQQKTKELQELEFISTEKLQQEYTFYVDTTQRIEEDLRQVKILETEVKYRKEKLGMLNAQLDQIIKDLEVQKTKQYPDIDTRIEMLQTSLFQREHDRDVLSKEVVNLIEKQQTYEMIKEGFKEVKSLSFQEVLQELNFKTNNYLGELFDSNINIKFSNLSVDGEVSKITTNITIDGVERSLGLFSGGQTRRIMLAVDLAISDIIHTRKGITDKLLILDEYFKDMSEESISKVCRLLSNVDAKIIMIEHNSMLNSLATNIFEIEYKNGISSVKN